MKNIVKWNTVAGVLMVMLLLLCFFKLSYIYLNGILHEEVLVESTDRFYSFNSLTGTKEFSCDNLEELTLLKKLGSGTYRDTYAGTYQGAKVAVKVVINRFPDNPSIKELTDREVKAESNCLQIFHDFKNSHVKELLGKLKSGCESLNVQHMLLDLVYHEILKSKRVIANIGFCVRNPNTVHLKNEKNVISAYMRNDMNAARYRSVLSVYELASDIPATYLDTMLLIDILHYMRPIVSMIETLHKTVAGPFGIGGFTLEHIATLRGEWVLIDLGSFDSGELPCGTDKWNLTDNRRTNTHRLQKFVAPGEGCPNGTPCVKGFCKEPYVKFNIQRLCDFVWKRLLNATDIYNKDTCYAMSTSNYIDYVESIVMR